jgi:FkbM family methyltransferase
MKNLNLKKYEITVDNHDIILYDIDSSKTLDFVIPEALYGDEYKLKDVNFQPGDIVLDIGANVGSVSILLAKKYPFLQIYSYEAHPINYSNLLKNIEANNITNIKAFHNAVYSEDNHTIGISMNIDNTGATNSFVDPLYYPGMYLDSVDVDTISLDTIITSNNIKNIKYLKIDCEGAEFEIFENSKLIENVTIENIGIEIHMFMENLGKSSDNLIELLRKNSKNQMIKLSV